MSGAAQVGVDIHALIGQTPYGKQVDDMVKNCCHNSYAAADMKATELGVTIDSVASGDNIALAMTDYLQLDPATPVSRVLLVDLDEDESATVNGVVVTNWPDTVAAISDGSAALDTMSRFASLSSFASGIAGVSTHGLSASTKLASYQGAVKGVEKSRRT